MQNDRSDLFAMRTWKKDVALVPVGARVRLAANRSRSDCENQPHHRGDDAMTFPQCCERKPEHSSTDEQWPPNEGWQRRPGQMRQPSTCRGKRNGGGSISDDRSNPPDDDTNFAALLRQTEADTSAVQATSPPRCQSTKPRVHSAEKKLDAFGKMRDEVQLMERARMKHCESLQLTAGRSLVPCTGGY